MNKKTTYAGAVIASVFIVLIVIFAIIGAAYSNSKSKYSVYRQEAVNILEKYKDGKYDEDEAQERLNDIRLDAMSAGIESSSEVDKEKYEFLQSEINAIVRSLKKGAVRDTDVDTTIRHIKNGR